MNISNENTVTLIAVIIAIIIGIFLQIFFKLPLIVTAAARFIYWYLCRLYRLPDCFVL